MENTDKQAHIIIQGIYFPVRSSYVYRGTSQEELKDIARAGKLQPKVRIPGMPPHIFLDPSLKDVRKDVRDNDGRVIRTHGRGKTFELEPDDGFTRDIEGGGSPVPTSLSEHPPLWYFDDIPANEIEVLDTQQKWIDVERYVGSLQRQTGEASLMRESSETPIAEEPEYEAQQELDGDVGWGLNDNTPEWWDSEAHFVLTEPEQETLKDFENIRSEHLERDTDDPER